MDTEPETETSETQQTETFTAEQMREVREEAKSWRLKLRAEEDRTKQLTADLETANTKIADLDGQLKQQQEQEQLRADVAEVAKAAGVPAEVLRGATREEIEAHAEQLKPAYAKQSGPYAPTLGEKPEGSADENLQFLRELFKNN